VLGPFDTDPCASIDQPWRTARIQYTIDDDGLHQAWDGMVWCNPPYGPQTWKWLHRLADHGTGIALTFARTETAGFFAAIWNRADALLFLKGRLHFHHPITGHRANANAGGPSVLIAYGAEAVTRLEHVPTPGALVRGWR
jgi:hypothetical protein